MRWEFTWTGQEGFELLGGFLRAGERSFELLRGALFNPWQGLVAGLKRAPHMGCVMPSVEGMRENSLQRVELPAWKGHPICGGRSSRRWEERDDKGT